MKIGLVVPHYYPDITGGIEWYAFNISQELANSRNNDIYIFTQLTKKANQKIELIGKV